MSGVQVAEPENINVKVQASPAPTGEWKAGLCNCCDAGCGIWCVTANFPCMTLGNNSEKIEKGSCCFAGCVWLLMGSIWCHCCVHMPLRKKIRERYNIPEGGECEDCCVTYFCFYCAICQEARQLQESALGVEVAVATRK
mmetsp:Transcript_4639/g.4782  ORF Transcript_4639/g.4782 Transcript_4639/m.4782 type:complete len:140 (+) Transcript_4639:106-525(+)